MTTTLNARNPCAYPLAREVAQRSDTGLTEALEQALERKRATTPLAERLVALAGHARSKAGPTPRPVTTADRDALWER